MTPRNALIWRATKNEASSYVMGTMHVRADSAFHVMDRVEKLLDEVPSFYSEVNLDELALINPFEGIRENSWSNRIQLGSSYSKIRKVFLKSSGLDIHQLDHLEPIVLLNIFSEMLLRTDHREPADYYLWNRAKDHGLTCKGIETLEENQQTMKSIDLAGQVSMLKNTVSNIPKFRKKILHLSDLYVAGRIHDLYQTSRKDLGRWKHALLFQRNRRMSERLIEYHGRDGIFLAVGAAHLSGKFGILHLLNSNGFKLKPLI